MNEKGFLDDLVAYSLENLKNLDFAPNVEYNIPEIPIDESSEMRCKLIRSKDTDNEFDDLDDNKK